MSSKSANNLNYSFQALQKCFHCYEPAERQIKIVPLIAALVSYEVFYKLPTDKSEDDQESESDEEVTHRCTIFKTMQ